ncbi:hypothetical protein TGFOU_358730 [Toxoplasma gondii FOU]|uniref:Uncharacterized protein n=1 Tax=Toxoplasma gondii FOU TaxID=943167 RepID=A0A086KTR7_TOXGO|nr:hypothetical protein TGFOU_358730 [Toxoplasma gondii FOU]
MWGCGRSFRLCLRRWGYGRSFRGFSGCEGPPVGFTCPAGVASSVLSPSFPSDLGASSSFFSGGKAAGGPELASAVSEGADVLSAGLDAGGEARPGARIGSLFLSALSDSAATSGRFLPSMASSPFSSAPASSGAFPSSDESSPRATAAAGFSGSFRSFSVAFSLGAPFAPLAPAAFPEACGGSSSVSCFFGAASFFSAPRAFGLKSASARGETPALSARGSSAASPVSATSAEGSSSGNSAPDCSEGGDFPPASTRTSMRTLQTLGVSVSYERHL